MSDTDDHIKAAYGPQPQYGPWRWDSSVDEIVRMDYCSSYARTRARRSNGSVGVPRWLSISVSLGISFTVAIGVMSVVTSSIGLEVSKSLIEQTSVIPVLMAIGLIGISILSIPYLPRPTGVGR